MGVALRDVDMSQLFKLISSNPNQAAQFLSQHKISDLLFYKGSKDEKVSIDVPTEDKKGFQNITIEIDKLNML